LTAYGRGGANEKAWLNKITRETGLEDKDATDYGEVPQGEKKGTIDPNFKPYGILYRV
jgi:hypothetical protein